MRKTFADRIYERLDGDLVKTAQALAHRSIGSTASCLTFRESEIDDAILSIIGARMALLAQEFFTASELATVLRVSSKTVLRMARRGALPCQQFG